MSFLPKNLLLPSLMASLACACGLEIVEGNGELASESREHADFDKLSVGTFADTNIVLGDAHSVSIHCDSNLLEHFDSRVEDATLFVDNGGAVVWTDLDCTLDVVMPTVAGLSNEGTGNMTSPDVLEGIATLENAGTGTLTLIGATHPGEEISIENNGAGSLNVAGLLASSILAFNSGAGDMTLAGEVTSANLENTGAGSLDAERLLAADVAIQSSGVGQVTVSASSSIEGSISGAGGLVVHGNPSSRDVTVSGAGVVVYR